MTGVARATSLDGGLAGRRVLVTAGAAGIGLAIVERLLAHEASVFVCDVNDATLHSFSKANPRAGAIKADVSNEADVDRMFAAVQATLGGLDALINNAGIAGPTGAVEDIDAGRMAALHRHRPDRPVLVHAARGADAQGRRRRFHY